MNYSVYALCEPDDPSITRYIGCSQQLRTRYNGHKSSQTKTGVWIRKLAKSGKRPFIKILYRGANGPQAEKRWIKREVPNGNLFNLCTRSEESQPRITWNARVVYPIHLHITQKAIKAAEKLIRTHGFETCRSRSAVLAAHCERLAK